MADGDAAVAASMDSVPPLAPAFFSSAITAMATIATQVRVRRVPAETGAPMIDDGSPFASPQLEQFGRTVGAVAANDEHTAIEQQRYRVHTAPAGHRPGRAEGLGCAVPVFLGGGQPAIAQPAAVCPMSPVVIPSRQAPPPTTSTRPSRRRVAVYRERAWASEPAGLDEPVARSRIVADPPPSMTRMRPSVSIVPSLEPGPAVGASGSWG